MYVPVACVPNPNTMRHLLRRAKPSPPFPGASSGGVVTGDQRNVLAPGDLLRQVDIPLAALRRRSAFRQISLTPVGRSAALLIGCVTSDGGLALTITASTSRPVRLSFAGIPNGKELRETILQRIADDLYHTDVHGKPIWRKHMTLRLAEEIRSELQGTA